MLERLQKTEEVLQLDSVCSSAYEPLVSDANTMRMLYASHHMKHRDSVLPILRQKLTAQKELEQEVLWQFVKKAEEVAAI